MRKILCVISLAAATALTSATAQAARYERDSYIAPAEATAGVVGGTVLGLGLSEGWIGPTVAGATLPTTVVGAATVGGVAGIGGIALIDSVVQPCRGFHAIFDLNHDYCAQLNGQQLRHAQRVSSRTHHRAHYAQR
jgi:hypothetical protein